MRVAEVTAGGVLVLVAEVLQAEEDLPLPVETDLQHRAIETTTASAAACRCGQLSGWL